MKKSFSLALYALALMPLTLGAAYTLHAQDAAQDAAQNASQDAAPAAAAPDTSAPEKVVNMLSAKLALTGDQKTQITPIIANRQAQLKALRDNTSMRRFQRARAARKIFEDSDKKINAILTPDQQKTYAALEQQMREQMRQRMQQQNPN
ncbi:MAG TPA: hypothetical protein VG893_01800 [Terracidiphilus sp.]|nr:hypothetical protein [Terracidiphilus sp.]